MANLKTKSPKFISLSGEMATGGAPIYADDIIRVQENDQADILNFFEANRRLLPDLATWDGATNLKQFENGLIISGLEYDNTDPANPVVSEGYILSGGEVCYYPGGTIATGLTNRGLLYLYKGAAVNTARTFSVGGSKDILVTYDTTIEVGQVTANGLELAGGTAITATDEVVVLGIGIAGDYLGEDYFTLRTASGVTDVANRVSGNEYSAVTLAGTNTVGTSLPYLVSRVNGDGTTEIHGSISFKAGEQSGTSVQVANVPGAAHNITSSGEIPLNSLGVLGNNYYKIFITGSGDIRITEPVAGWPGVTFDIVISTKVYGSTTAPTAFKYDNAFLDIT